MNSQQGGFPLQMQYQQQQQQQQQQAMGTQQYLNKQVQQQQQQQLLRMQQQQQLQQQQQQLLQPQSDMLAGNGVNFMSMLQQQSGSIALDNLKKKTTLIGRLEELKNAPVEKHMYIFGMDIPQTGIANLNQDTQINATFGSPFAENPSIKTDSLNFTIPQSYLKPQVTLNAGLVKKLPEDTLFYIFYNFPEDTQQFAAVLALYERGWRYNQTQLSWMRNLEETAKGIYKGEYFDFTAWKIAPLNGVAINEADDLVSVADFEKQLGNHEIADGITENNSK